MSIRVHEFQPRVDELEVILLALKSYQNSIDCEEEESVELLIEEIESLLQEY